MISADELLSLHLKIVGLKSDLVEVRGEYFDALEEENRDEFEELYTNVDQFIQHIESVVGQLRLNGFAWTRLHSNAVNTMITEANDGIESLSEFAMELI